METDLLDGKYGSLGINAIADWLGHSPKVMLTHYKRVSEDKFRQVTQYEPAQKRPQNIGSNFDSTKSPEMCVSPEITMENVNSALAVYLAVHSPEQGINRRQGTETGQAPMLSQLLVNRVLAGNKRQETVHDGIAQKCNNGEDRIRTCGTHTSSRI